MDYLSRVHNLIFAILSVSNTFDNSEILELLTCTQKGLPSSLKKTVLLCDLDVTNIVIHE